MPKMLTPMMSSSFRRSRAPLAALLVAFFAAACQPAATDAASAPEAAPEASVGASELASFAAGDLERLEFGHANTFPADAALLGPDGAALTLADFKSRVVVLNLWGEWCAPCVDEMPTLASLQKAFPKDKVAVVPVAVGDPDALQSSAAKLKELAGEELPFFYDSNWNITEAVKSGAFPSTILYAADGREVARLIYPAHWDSDQAKALVQAVVDGKG
jgi:thiol-disulfide isomerase/thioredoxin